MKILVTGGGSSGHISPALAIILALQELAPDSVEFLYLGGKTGLEKKLVEAEGIAFQGVETGKLRRYFSAQNFSDALRIPLGVGQSLRAVKQFGPNVVLATGGYVAVPPTIAAWALRVPVVIHEQTVQIGLANRIMARLATRIGLSFESALQELPPNLRPKAFVAGNPVRPQIFNGDQEKAKAFAAFDAQDDGVPCVYFTGGSQGARIINRAVEAALPDLLTICRVIHQCGAQPAGDEQDFDRLERVASRLSPELKRRYFVTRFIRAEINDVFALCDLVVGRAGAGTVTELCALGKPALYIPLVPTGGDEQTRNAQMCRNIGAAQIIRQTEFTSQRLLETLRAMLSNRQQLQDMGVAAQTLAKPEAARDMARAVLSLIRS